MAAAIFELASRLNIKSLIWYDFFALEAVRDQFFDTAEFERQKGWIYSHKS
jgi:hypothetical protein